jgi:hypothetical protein
LPWIDRLRQAGEGPLTLEALRQRSDLAAEALDEVYPTWKIQEVLSDHFGSNFLFFPLTPVGLAEQDRVLLSLKPGRDTLKSRTLAPFGVSEPILWLLHALGYRVLE